MNFRSFSALAMGWLMMASGSSWAAGSLWDFLPSALEWEIWPLYCRVQWTEWNGGYDLENRPIYSNGTRAQWKAAVGDKTYESLHHWCASIHYLSRSKGSAQATEKTFLLGRARDDADFSYQRADPGSLVYPAMSITVAQIQIEFGNRDRAIDTLKKAIAAQPARVEPYGALAAIYRKQKKLEDARNVLLAADEGTDGESAEVQYNLGLANIEVGDIDAAVLNAQAAYKMDYPFPGLKNKLIRLGRWQP